MRAICIREPGGLDVLEMREVAEPQPGPYEVRVAVRATGLNRADLLQRRGMYPPPPGEREDIPGLEFSGVVEALGEKATRFKVGDRVMGLVGSGAYAEKVALHERTAVRVPRGGELGEAAAIPEACATAGDALLPQAQLRPGERVLVSAVGSGVGTAALQVARALGATVLGTSRTEDKLRRCRALGLEHARHLQSARFADEIRVMTGGVGVDVVLELVGGDYVEEDLAAMAPKGRLVLVGLMAGNFARVPLGLLLTRRLSMRGPVLRSRPIEEKIEAALARERELVPLFEQGKLSPVIDEAVPVSDVKRAHERLETNASFGKIVLVW